MDDVIIYMQQLTKYTKKLTYLDWSDEYFFKNKRSLKGMNIAISKNLDGIVDYVDDTIWQKTKEVAMYLQSMGANVDFVEPPLSKTKLSFYQCTAKLLCMICSRFGEYALGVENGKYINNMDPGLLKRSEKGKEIIKNADEIIEIIQTRDQVQQIMNKFHDKYDILITPSTPILPPKAKSWMNHGKMKDMNTGEIVNFLECNHGVCVFLSLFNFTGQPALTMPSAYIPCNNNGKIPIGVQIAGGVDKDNLVLKVGYCLENKFKYLPAKL